LALSNPRDFLADLFSAAVRAADPLPGIINHLPRKPKGRTVVIGAGKGAAQMARVALHLTPRIRRSNFRGIARHLI
jgi:glycerate 2-kinase